MKRCQHCRRAAATVVLRDDFYGLVGEFCLRDGVKRVKRSAERKVLPLRICWLACRECGGEGRRSDGNPCGHCTTSLAGLLA